MAPAFQQIPALLLFVPVFGMRAVDSVVRRIEVQPAVYSFLVIVYNHMQGACHKFHQLRTVQNGRPVFKLHAIAVIAMAHGQVSVADADAAAHPQGVIEMRSRSVFCLTHICPRISPYHYFQSRHDTGRLFQQFSTECLYVHTYLRRSNCLCFPQRLRPPRVPFPSTQHKD